MRIRASRYTCGCLLAAVMASPCEALAAEPSPDSKSAPAIAAPSLDAALVEYRRKLEEYTRARQQYGDEAAAYWRSVSEKRRLRNSKRRNNQEIVLDDYVLTQPPVYAGPAKPVDPSAPVPQMVPPPSKYVPVVADFLKSAEEQFNFVPQRPQSEIEYKRAYAKVASAAGLTKEQAVRIYGFEAGGNGTYDVQAGLEYPALGARASTTALGYNQLLNTTSVELMAEHGDQFLKALKAKAAKLNGVPTKTLESKIDVLQRMVNFSRTVPDDWSEHEKLANTPKGRGIHAMNLDIDIGPLLQTQQLMNSVIFARQNGFKGTLSAAELEMMNLTGDGNGFDMVTMAAELRDQVPTSNFFQKEGYDRNPVASRNNVVAKLLAATNAKMDKEVKLQGAMELAATFP
jgi:hypothetical protein